MLPSKYRFPFKEYFNFKKKAQRIDGPFFRVLTSLNSLDYPRFSVVVSKDFFPKAVDRNKIKRRVHQVLQENLNNFPKNQDLVIFVKKCVKDKAILEIEKEIKTLF